ncbi:MAG: M28 family peptidase [Bacteroidetes bacterium]|nr:M28 family peptidase [Bacteroidota bacterium]
MKTFSGTVFFIFVSIILIGQPNKYYPLLRSTFQGNNAYQTVAFVEQRWRIAGNTGFNESIWYVEKILQQAGYTKEINGEVEGPLTYRIEKRKMNRPTWEPISASLSLASDNTMLLQYSSNRNMIAINSVSTPIDGVMAEVVYVGKGTVQDFEGMDVKGKIVFGEMSVRSLYVMAIKYGAIGVLAYDMPAYTQPEKYRNSIQFEGIPHNDSIKQKWGILLSYQAKERLKAAITKGKVEALVKIATRYYQSEELTIVANARGTTHPDERFVFSAHVQEPGANDNATGVGTLAEMARVTAELIQGKKYSPIRTITFLWGDEIISTDRYIQDDSTRAKGIKWGLSLDMVGEDVSKTGGSFLIEKMPDPSAIWTRGKEKHTEWGCSNLKESDMFPHYFNDFLLNRCQQQGKENGWEVNSNPFEGGSDHTPFLKAKIPGLLMWHFTDVFYHTDADRIEMVSPEEMKNVGVSALAAAYTLVSADETTSLLLINEICLNSLERLQTEYELSKEAIAKGSKRELELHILDAWTSWYKTAIEKMVEIPTGGSTNKINNKITDTIKVLETKNRDLQALLKK